MTFEINDISCQSLHMNSSLIIKTASAFLISVTSFSFLKMCIINIIFLTPISGFTDTLPSLFVASFPGML